jgi:hypothetical protein
MTAAQPNLIAYAAAALLVALLLFLRMRRMKRSRPLNLKRLWIAPVIFLTLAVTTLAQFPPHGLDWAWLGFALIAGTIFGWQRGRLMEITVDPASRALTTQATPMAIYFLLGLVVIRMGLRAGLRIEAQNWGLSVGSVNDIFIAFVMGLFAAQQLEMSIRARRLLDSQALSTSVAAKSDD